MLVGERRWDLIYGISPPLPSKAIPPRLTRLRACRAPCKEFFLLYKQAPKNHFPAEGNAKADNSSPKSSSVKFYATESPQEHLHASHKLFGKITLPAAVTFLMLQQPLREGRRRRSEEEATAHSGPAIARSHSAVVVPAPTAQR